MHWICPISQYPSTLPLVEGVYEATSSLILGIGSSGLREAAEPAKPDDVNQKGVQM
jgi:hypothetical protein